jgi:hypothetical protein
MPVIVVIVRDRAGRRGCQCVNFGVVDATRRVVYLPVCTRSCDGAWSPNTFHVP